MDCTLDAAAAAVDVNAVGDGYHYGVYYLFGYHALSDPCCFLKNFGSCALKTFHDEITLFKEKCSFSRENNAFVQRASLLLTSMTFWPCELFLPFASPLLSLSAAPERPLY